MKTLNYHIYLLVALLGFAGCSEGNEEENSAAEKEPTAREILKENNFRTGEIKRQPITKSFKVTGMVDAPPQSTAQVYPQTGAFVQEVFVIKGQEVKKGERLASLSHPEILNLQQRYLNARNSLEQNKADYLRKQKLMEDEAVSSKQLQQSKAAYLSAQSDVQSLGTTLRNMGVNPESLSGENLQEIVFLTAPIEGHIMQNRAGVGQYASTDSPLFTIVSKNHLHLELQVPPSKVDLVKVGNPVSFATRTHDQKMLGEVYMVNQVADGMGFFMVHAHFSDSLKKMHPGSYAEVEVIYQSDTLAALPQTAVVVKDGKSYVVTLEGDDFKQVPVLTGMSSDSLVSIVNAEDLAGKKIVLNGVKYLLAEEAEGALINNGLQ